MSKIAIFNLEGKSTKTKEVADFAVKENPALLAQAVNTALANRRNPIANTKNRGEVSGGGRDSRGRIGFVCVLSAERAVARVGGSW